MSDDEDEATGSVNPRPLCESNDVKTRYLAGVKRLIYAIDRYTGVYDFVPFLVAENVPANILRTLPSNVYNHHVKCQVINGNLFILELSTGPEHGVGVAYLIEQVGVWRSGHSTDDLVESTTDSDDPNGNNNSAPDVVLAAGPAYRLANTSTKIGKEFVLFFFKYLSIRSFTSLATFTSVIIELEVSNRSIPHMRRDYSPYFNDPALFGVLGIKLLGTSKYLFSIFSISLTPVFRST